jgi:eukaryotic-like serine/threonine-protein kinase
VPLRERSEGAIIELRDADRYRIEAVLGTGGMGEVYRGTDTVLGRVVAIKFLTERAAGRSIPERIVSEARSASALSHPNICTVYEVSEFNGQPCIVMEYVEGHPLSTSIPPGVGLPIETTVSYGMQIADALAHAHDSGVVHRDLKSANIIITSQQRVKVLDFGLAVQDAGKGVDDETSTLDELHTVSDPGTSGTLRYMAPEVLRGERADRQSDIWALGAVLYEMAAGKRPFNGRTPHEISAAILTQSPEPLSARIPSGVRSIIQTCLTKERGRRYRSASEVRAALGALQRQVQGENETTSLGRRIVTAAALVAMAVIIVVLFQVTRTMLQREKVVESRARPPVASAPVVPSKRLAVVPKVDDKGPVEDAALTETVVERIINGITSIAVPGLKLTAFSTVVLFGKDSGDPVVRAREELQADFVATIKITTRGNHLTFGAAIDETEDRSHIWGHTYERTKNDLFTTEADVAWEILTAVWGRVMPGVPLKERDRSKLFTPPTSNVGAFQLYAEGRRLWLTPTATPNGYQKSIELFEAAIKEDPNFALAYLGRADAYGSLAWEGWIPPSDGQREMEQALKKVDELDPNLGQAHYTRGALKNMQRDYAAAEAEYRAAIRSGDPFTANRRFFAYFLLGRQRPYEALRVLKDVLEQDPEGLALNVALATTQYWMGDFDEAILCLNNIINARPLDPAVAVAREILADVYEKKKSFKLAIGQREQTLRLLGETAVARQLHHDYITSGFALAMHNLYRRQLDAAIRGAMGGYISPLYIAVLYIHLNDPNRAFEYLENAVDEKAPWLGVIRADPEFESLRTDARFERLVQRYETPEKVASH